MYCKMANELYVLAEVDNLSQVFAPLKSTNRIKYTCFAVSKNFLIFGATSGGLYVFKREPCIFLQLLPNKDGSVTRVSISPDEKFFAFATLKGLVCVLERTQLLKIRRLQVSVEHQRSEVTVLQWNAASNELFVGDDVGKVSVVSVSPFMAKNMFQHPTFPLMQLDSRIVQLDWCSELLLVSTISRCYICDTFKEQYRQIGQKLRDGEYGACFYTAGDQSDLPERPEIKEIAISGAFSSLNEGEKLSGYEGVQNLKIFCARPGSRLWQVHIDGSVLSTHQFKHAFSIPPVGIIRTYEIDENSQDVSALNSSGASMSQQSFNFTKLYVIANKYLFTFKHDGLCVLDPVKGDVVLWTNVFKDINEVSILSDVIYVWTASGNFHSVEMLPLDRFLVRLYFRKQYALCAQLCLRHNNHLLELVPTSSKLQLLADLGNKLGDSELSIKVSPLLHEITKYAQEKQNAHRLKSGIFLVGNTQFFWNEESNDEGSKELMSTSSHVHSLRVDRHDEKSRSLSASPENVRKKRSFAGQPQRRTASTLSLPELERCSFENKYSEIPVPSESRVNAEVLQLKPELSTKSSDSLNFSDTTFPPEALQAFRELKQNFSWKILNTKSLKEKWQVLEDKMKLLNVETNVEPLDVRPVDYQETIEEEKILVEDLELVHSSTATVKQQFPVIDTSICIELCKYLSENDTNVDKSNMLPEFLDVCIYTYNLFLSALMKDGCDIEVHDDSVQSSSSSSNNLKIVINSVGPFPFSYYFADETVRTIRDHFHMAVNSSHLFRWLRVKVQEIQNIPLDQFPEQFEVYCSKVMLKFDFFLSRILIIFSDIMDPKLILHSIKREELPCYYLSLCMILDRYQESSLHHIAQESPEHDCYEEMPLPVLLNTIFYMLSMERIESCCKLAKQVCTKDVWYLVLRLQQHVEATGKDKDAARIHCYSLFISYLEKVSASKDCLSELLTDDQLRSFVASVFEELNYVENGSCVCGFPLLNPPVLPYPELAELMVVYYWENSQGRLLEMCKSVPSLWHLILPRKRNGDFVSVLPLIIHLGSASEFVNWISCMSYQDWEKTLELLVVFRGGTCLNCGSKFTTPGDKVKGISWSSLGPLLVKGVGSQKALQLLSKYSPHIDPGELDERFFQTCIFSAIVDSHSDGLRNEVIDLFSEYATKTADTAIFSPVVASSVEEALKEDLGRRVEFPLSSERHHWGVKINLENGNCPCCLLPLGSPVLMRDGGVTTFRCGHSFHVVCLRRRSSLYSCPICTKTS